MNSSLAILNAAICLWVAVFYVRRRNVLAFPCMLNFYLALLFVRFFLFEHELLHEYSWTGYRVIVGGDSLNGLMEFSTACNLAMFLGMFVGNAAVSTMTAAVPQSMSEIVILRKLFVGYLCGGSVAVLMTFWGGSYSDFVEFDGSNWGSVFFMAAAPLIVLLWKHNSRRGAILACLPFLFVGIYLGVRSFLLFSLISLILFAFVLPQTRVTRALALRYLTVVAALVGVAWLILLLRGEASSEDAKALPEEGLIRLYVTIYPDISDWSASLSLEGIRLMGVALIAPILKQFVSIATVTDAPVAFARILMRAPDGELNKFYHFPATWYSEALYYGGAFGPIYGFFWGLIFAQIGKLVAPNSRLWLMLPYYCWFVYLVTRGASFVAVAGIVYPVGLVAVTLLIAKIISLRRESAG